ncbi:MAG: NRDE family protein [Flavobacteriales bacterium]
MCTLTYLPINNNKFLVGSNRDEHIQRPSATLPIIVNSGNMPILAPIDPQGKGSWFGYNIKLDKKACLLNGAFIKHEHTPPYSKSRGLIMIESLSYKTLHNFSKVKDFENIEPFTLIHINNDSIEEIRWDEEKVYYESYSKNKPMVWSSSMLYDSSIKKNTQEHFNKKFNNKEKYEEEELLDFQINESYKEKTKGNTIASSSKISTVNTILLNRSSNNLTVNFYDWQTQINAKQVLNL